MLNEVIEILPPPEYRPLHPSEYPHPRIRTSPVTVEKLQASYASGDIETFREILDSQPSSSEAFEICDFYSIMTDAIGLGNLVFIQELLRHGMPLGQTYLRKAIHVKNKTVLELFLQNGLDLNASMGEFTPPILSYSTTDLDMVTWFLDHGADPNQQCFVDLTPLSIAIEDAPISVIELMLRRGGDVRRGQLLHHAVERKEDNITVLKLLVDNGADINSTMYEGHDPSLAMYCFMDLGTPLHRAAELGQVDVVRYLLGEGADVSIKDAKGHTALECAQRANQSEVIHLLEEAS